MLNENLLSSSVASLSEMYRTRMAHAPLQLDLEETMLKPFDRAIGVRPKNWLTPVTLVVLREERSHGYELLERLEEFGFEEITQARCIGP